LESITDSKTIKETIKKQIDDMLIDVLGESVRKREYNEWMRAYVAEHLDEIGLIDGEDAMD
jgi:uncharacterized protein YnzC (UPF0291/DUF896 family)